MEVLRSGWMRMSRNRMLSSAEGCSMVYSRSGAIELRWFRKDSACCLLRK